MIATTATTAAATTETTAGVTAAAPMTAAPMTAATAPQTAIANDSTATAIAPLAQTPTSAHQNLSPVSSK